MAADLRTPSARAWGGLLLILLVGGTLRLWGIGAGAPSRMGVDEPVILETTLRILQTGDLNPHFFDYGGLTFYLHTGVSAVAFLSGASSGRWDSVGQLWIGDLLTPTRTATALFGTLTILVLFRVGLRWGESTALVAALIVAVLPPHVRESHFTLTDTPLTLAVSLVMLLAVRAAESRSLVSIALAGAAVGLAAGVKYNGALAAIMPVVAAAAFPAGRRVAAITAAAAASAGAFLLVAPFTLLDLPGFLNGFGAILGYYGGARSTGEAAWIYVRHARSWFAWPGVLPLEIGFVSLGLALVGFSRLLSRTRTSGWRWAGAIPLAFALAHFWLVSNQGSLVYGRYLLPLAPMLVLALAAGLVALADLVARRVPRLAPAALPLTVALMLAAPVGAAIAFTQEHARPSTLDQVGRWLTSRLGPNEKVVMEGSPVQAPPRIPLARTGQLVEKTLEDYQASGVAYLITSSEVTDAYRTAPAGREQQAAAHRVLLARTEVVQTFAPNETRSGPTLTILRVPRPTAPSERNPPRQ